MRAFERVAQRRREQREKEDTLYQTVQQFLERDEDRYLGNPDVIEALLREAVAKVIEARMEAGMAAEGGLVVLGQPNPPEKEAQAQAEKIAKVVLGRDKGFDALGPQWNSPTGGVIGQIRRRYDLAPDEPEAIAAHPFWSILEAYGMAQLEAEGGRDWEHLIDGEIELAVAVLTGTDQVSFPFDS